MSVHRIASRYAKSLVDLAVEQNKLERVKEDVATFKEVTKIREFYLLLKNPIVTTEKKAAIIKTLFADKYDELTLAFLDILVKKGREAHLPEIAEEFLIQYKHIKHISTVKLTTAKPLTETALKAIHDKLASSAQTDDVIEIKTKVDPKLIGGFIVEFEDNVYDASVAHKLDEFKKEFKDNLYVSLISK